MTVLYTLISTATLALCGWIGRMLTKQRSEFKVLKDSQRNQLKMSIVQSYELARERGHITQMELETLNRAAESYAALGGNTYIAALVERANRDMEVGGEPIPEH